MQEKGKRPTKRKEEYSASTKDYLKTIKPIKQSKRKQGELLKNYFTVGRNRQKKIECQFVAHQIRRNKMLTVQN